MDRLQQISQAYLSHRLNQRELKKMVKTLQQGSPAEARQCLDRHFSLESLHNGIENKLHDPWLSVEDNIHPDGNDDGTFTMPLLDFYSSFCWLTAGS